MCQYCCIFRQKPYLVKWNVNSAAHIQEESCRTRARKDRKHALTHFDSRHQDWKVKKILKGSLDLIQSPSPSVKIQIICRKVCLRWKGKTLLGVVNKLCFQKFVDNTQQCFAFMPQVNFPAHNLNFHWRWRWWDLIQATF